MALNLSLTLLRSRYAFASLAQYSSNVGPLSKKELLEEIEHATGLEKTELESQLHGTEVFGPTALHGEFGTVDHPVVVPSYFTDRIVGCTGSKSEPHELRWHVVSNEKPTVCLGCGQFFVINRIHEHSQDCAHHH